MSPLGRQGHVTEGGLSTSPKAEATRGHVGWGGCAVLEQSRSIRGHAGRISAGHNGPMQCQIQMTFRKWDLIFRGQGKGSVAKHPEFHGPCSGVSGPTGV